MNINNPTTFSTPALVYSTSNSSGSAGSLRADDTLAIFSSTVPTTLAYSASAATGDNAFGSREDHVHGVFGSPIVDISCRIYNNANQAVADSTAVKLAMNAEQFDTDTMHDVTTNNSRITINTEGKYLCGLNDRVGGAANHIKSYILLNNTTIIASNETTHADGGNLRQIAATLYDFSEDDYIELVIYQNSGNAGTTYYDAYAAPILWCVKIGG